MGCTKSKPYIAKETYHPFENEWEGFTTQSFNEEDSKVIDFLVLTSYLYRLERFSNKHVNLRSSL